MAAAAMNEGTAVEREALEPACRASQQPSYGGLGRHRPTNAKESKPRSAVSRNLRSAAANKLEETVGGALVVDGAVTNALRKCSCRCFSTPAAAARKMLAGTDERWRSRSLRRNCWAPFNKLNLDGIVR